jgi:SNF2 family DNA or RNA helicase
VHRLGQTRPVTVIRLVARGTIEEIILRRSVHKLQRTEQIVDSAHLHGAAPADSDEKELDVLSHGD